MLPVLPALLGPLALTLGPSAGPLPQPLQTPREAGPAQEREVERLEAWPELPRSERRQVKLEIDKLRKAATEGMESSAREALAGIGDRAAPMLLRSLSKERLADARERFAEVLESLVDARHTRLLAEHLDDRSLELRIFCLQRVAAYPDPALFASAEKAWAMVQARKEKGEADGRELDAAALACLSAGSPVTLEAVFERTKKRWAREGLAIRAACEGARSDEATRELLPHLDGTKQEKLAALRMLAGCGTKLALPELKHLLDSSDQALRVATLDALRGIVDGLPPMGRASVFDTIEEIDKWKKRI